MAMTIEQFCDKHLACTEGRKWALSCGSDTMAELWKREDLKREWREWIYTREGVLTKSDALRFSCWSVRQIWYLLTDERSRKAVEVVEAFLEGNATITDIEAARAAASAAARDVASDAARVAAWAAARDVARAAKAAQNKWLIENTTPNFEEKPSPAGA